ncbi:MAG: nitrate reductase molybdenum cofactor assembly chaperone [Rhodospirillales bacterium]
MRTFKALGVLLTYPEDSLIEALDEIGDAIAAEGLLKDKTLAALAPLYRHLRDTPLMTLQEEYVSLFDRSRTLSLHLYEHLHGESRDRGAAMARLAAIYRMRGFEIGVRELPDFLPLLCEFLSLIGEKASRALLADAAAILEGLRIRLEERESPYATVLEALVALAGGTFDEAQLRQILEADSDDANDAEGLDAYWSEEPVTFGPESPGIAAPAGPPAFMPRGGC